MKGLKIKKEILKIPLIIKIRHATQTGDLQEPFTQKMFTEWMEKESIIKDDGKPYAQSSIISILPNSCIENAPTSNTNFKILQRKINKEGLYEYWF